jgi:N-acyl-D-amino-acid deacylase
VDYLIVNARLVDPESGMDVRGALGIAGDKIAGVYPEGLGAASGLLAAGAARVVDAAGGLLTPGFIDVHSHTDNDRRCGEKLLAQGVTTTLSGNCGMGPVDFPAFRAEFERAGYPINQAEQIGHTNLRRAAGHEDIFTPVDRRQRDKMKALARRAFDDGAYGLSFGLEYVPGADPQEVLEIARIAAEARRLMSIHIRLNPPDTVDALDEALDLVSKTGGRLIISHLVYMYTGEMLKRAVKLLGEFKRRGGGDVWVDSGMYTAFATGIGTPFFAEDCFFARGMSLNKLRAATGKYAGQVLDLEKYREMRRDFPLDHVIYDMGEPEDIFTAYSLPDVMVSTDAGAAPPGQGHPQGAATYPFFFRLLVKETGRLALPDALRRCALLPAQALGCEQKGRLAPGADADLVVLDWDRLRESAAFPGMGDPDAPPQGVTHVFVNGVLEIENGRRLPGVNSGRILQPRPIA